MVRPRWLEPRVEGTLVRDGIPDDFLDRLAAHLREHGFHVIDAPPGPTDYRVPATRTRSLRLKAGPRAKGDLVRAFVRQLEMTHEDEHVLRYAVIVPQPVPLGPLVLAPIAAIVALLALVSQNWAMLEAVSTALVVVTVSLVLHRVLLRDAIERLVDEELDRAPVQNDEGPSYAQLSASNARPSASHAESAPSLAKETPHLRIPPESPALAATVRTARDAFVHHPERSPEEEVRALEETSRRRGE